MISSAVINITKRRIPIWYMCVCQGAGGNTVFCITQDMVKKAVQKMKNGKAAGPSGVVSEMIKAAEEEGIEMITNLVKSNCN